ncbi:MAG: hypothetical protein Q4G43_17780, partial [Mobilicoccus sp.]|nr:hypothetical protein [Mobilicoccus sp.]
LLAVVSVQSLTHAYRYEALLPPRGLETATAVVAPEGASLRLTAEDARTSAELAQVREQYGLAGTPILDVTGASPGYIRQLGGRPVGSSWLLGGYPGSDAAALDAVATDPHGVQDAWVLDAPDSPRRIEGLLPGLGLSVERDFEPVATFRHVLGYDVVLLRPVD